MSKQITTAIIGATGYTGVELMRILLKHPNVRIASITSRQYTKKRFAEVCPSYEGVTDLVCEPLKIESISKRVELAFLCLPHHEAMSVAKGFRLRGVRVIDLSADFRIKDIGVYEKWYGSHSQKKLVKEAVYGLPEIHGDEIKKTKLVAVPGCYPTSIILGLAPLLKKKMIAPHDIICDSKSGVSGAGRSAKVETLYCEVNDSFRPYNIGKHRHLPEIEQELSTLAGTKINILFSPHLVPMDRGILSTIYVKPLKKWTDADLIHVYKKFYSRKKFVKILPIGVLPSTKNVRGSNMCHLSVLFDQQTERIIVVSAIDNLTKGASGQAVQCMNLMYGWPEGRGLENCGLIP